MRVKLLRRKIYARLGGNLCQMMQPEVAFRLLEPDWLWGVCCAPGCDISPFEQWNLRRCRLRPPSLTDFELCAQISLTSCFHVENALILQNKPPTVSDQSRKPAGFCSHLVVSVRCHVCRVCVLRFEHLASFHVSGFLFPDQTWTEQILSRFWAAAVVLPPPQSLKCSSSLFPQTPACLI